MDINYISLIKFDQQHTTEQGWEKETELTDGLVQLTDSLTGRLIKRLTDNSF